MVCFLFNSSQLSALDFGDDGPRGQQDRASGTMEEPRRAFLSSSSHFRLFVLIFIHYFVLGVLLRSLCICPYTCHFSHSYHASLLFLGYLEVNESVAAACSLSQPRTNSSSTCYTLQKHPNILSYAKRDRRGILAVNRQKGRCILYIYLLHMIRDTLGQYAKYLITKQKDIQELVR